MYGAFPPPSPTFQVAPGGAVTIAKEPWIVRAIKLPNLHSWVTTARMSSAVLLGPGAPKSDSSDCVWYPEGHEFTGLNEEMLRDLFGELASWTSPVVIAGDLNVIENYPTLCMAHAFGFHRISGWEATTMNNQGLPRSGPPIDHVLMNNVAANLLTHCATNQKVSVSDHFPIEFTMRLPTTRFRVVKWPSRVTEPLQKQHTIEAPTHPRLLLL